MDCPAASTLSPDIFSNICIVSNASNNVPVMLAFIGCCANTTSTTAQVTSDDCYHYCNLTSFEQETAMESCLSDKLDGEGLDVGSFDIEYLGALDSGAANTALLGSASGFASLSSTGNISSSVGFQSMSASNYSVSLVITSAVITPLGTTTKSTSGAKTAASATPKQTSGSLRKKVEWSVGFLMAITLATSFMYI